MKLKISPKEENDKVIDLIHHLFLQSFKFPVQMTQLFFQVIHFGPMTWGGRTEAKQLVLKADTERNLILEQALARQLSRSSRPMLDFRGRGWKHGVLWNKTCLLPPPHTHTHRVYLYSPGCPGTHSCRLGWPWTQKFACLCPPPPKCWD
jgi:hypothetical protein